MIGTKVINSINRNIVECKGCYQIGFCANFSVLIETLWNVKEHIRLCFQSHVCCINRNIVECKVRMESRCSRFRFCINRNIVECKAD